MTAYDRNLYCYMGVAQTKKFVKREVGARENNNRKRAHVLSPLSMNCIFDSSKYSTYAVEDVVHAPLSDATILIVMTLLL